MDLYKYKMDRKICKLCKKKFAAVNYLRKGKVYYRSCCTACSRNKQTPQPEVSGWIRSGYKKRDKCDLCNFKFAMSAQSLVYYVDGNLNNNNWSNLKTICQNCKFSVTKTNWRPSSLQPDF